jgi:hypothetical protein
VKCQTCNKEFQHKHPSQRFCSHKGPRNCKDRFHNGSPTRVKPILRPINEDFDDEYEDPGDDEYYQGKDDAWFTP